MILRILQSAIDLWVYRAVKSKIGRSLCDPFVMTDMSPDLGDCCLKRQEEGRKLGNPTGAIEVYGFRFTSIMNTLG